MKTKDLFDKGISLKSIRNKTKNDFREDVESPRYIEAYSEKRQRFLPDTDFTTASNFARFGSAELYYESAIKRIYQTYPYDGSQAEKLEWENKSNYLDLFIFENEYPRTNGYIVINSGSSSSVYSSTKDGIIYSSSAPQYIFIKGGPHPDPDGDYKSIFSAGPDSKNISKANVWHTASQRTNNLELDVTKGVTVEFWMKKDGWPTSTAYEFVFHNITSGTAYGSSGHGSFSIFLNNTNSDSKNNLYLNIVSGSTTAFNSSFETGLTDIADGKWHHYAVAVKDTVADLYVDGTHSVTKTITSINPVTGTMLASLGSLAGVHVGTTSATLGWGNIISASFDEFRYWKSKRNAKQIGRFFRDQVGGGTNTDNVKYDSITNKVDLGVYYKFNEGITQNSLTDSVTLDYSGRISNGAFINYVPTVSRNTGSAIIESSAAAKEFKDPIIYSDHPSVSSLLTSKKVSGSAHDFNNPISIYKTLPSWIVEEDEAKSGHLEQLTQIIASFFDDLYLQIEKLPRLKDINYPYDENYEKPLPFAERLLETRGYDAPRLFEDISILSQYLERDEKKLYEKKIYEIKNTIYQNIYNNLTYIQKSKGTYKSLRNFLRCFGVDEELIKLNIYSSGDTFELKDNFVDTAVRKKYLDFDDPETRLKSTDYYQNSYTATAYQATSSLDSNSLSYIPAISTALASGSSATIEVEVIFPKRSIVGDTNYQLFPSLTSSLFGMHAVLESNTDYAYASDNDINFSVVATKPDSDLRNVKFALLSSGSSPVFSQITNTNSYMGVYDNEKWNLAFRLRPTKYPYANLVTGSLDSGSSAYTYELYGVNYISNIFQNEFTLSGTISYANAEKFFTSPKRLFVGAQRTNFTGSEVQKYSDVKISSVRYWLDYLSDETIHAHAKNAFTYGRLHPYKNTNFAISHNDLFNFHIPEIETLALNWTMDNVTGSDAYGRFLIEDFASGSATDRSNSRYGWVSDITKYNYAGQGNFFTSGSSVRDQVVDVEFVQTSKQKLPEIVNSDDMVKILNKQDDVVFTRDSTYVQHFLSVEKSMYQTISEEMLRFFATIVDFNNLIGEPIHRYRPQYKSMEKLRDLFFEKVENEPDIDKFIEYYKWVDEAVTVMIQQLIPASAESNQLLRNMVESHILERNKYQTPFPTIDTKVPDLVAAAHGVEELKYNWKFGHGHKAEHEFDPAQITIKFIQDGSTSANKTLTLTDHGGNTVVYKIASNSTVDGSLHSDGSSINVGLTGFGASLTGLTLAQCFASAINATTTTSNGKTLNIIASAHRGCYTEACLAGVDPGYYQGILTLVQGAPGPEGNTDISTTIASQVADIPGKFIGGHEVEQKNCFWWHQRAERNKLPISSSIHGVNSDKDQILKIAVTEVSGSEPILKTVDGTKYAGSYYPYRSLRRLVTVDPGKALTLKGGGNPEDNKIHDYYKSVIKWGSDDDFIYLDVDNEIKQKVCYDGKNGGSGWAPELGKSHFKMKALTMPANETTDSNAAGTGVNDLKYTDAKSTLLLPFSVFSSSLNTGYRAAAYDQHGLEFTNLHEDKYGPQAEVPMQGPFSEKYVGGMQHRHVPINIGAVDGRTSRPEGWHLQQFISHSAAASDGVGIFLEGSSLPDVVINENFLNATTTPTKDVSILDLPVPSSPSMPFSTRAASETPGGDEPSEYEYWLNGVSTDNQWTFLQGPTPSVGTGPVLSGVGSYYAYCEVLPSKVGQTFGLTTPLIDWLQVNTESDMQLTFKYHMHGIHMGTLRVQASTDRYFQTDVNTLFVLSGQQHILPTTNHTEKTISLNDYIGKRYYIRFHYTAGISHLGDCAITYVNIGLVKPDDMSISAGPSFKLLSPTHDNHHRPSAIYTRQEFAKRPVNIRNIHMTGTSPTKAGNFLDRYEYVSTVSPEANDPFFVKNTSEIKSITPELLMIHKVENLLSTAPGANRTSISYQNFQLPDRSYISGTVKNRTRIMSRFSSPGGFETLSRGFLDPAHETYSVYNVLGYKDLSSRMVYNTQMTAHCGKFGVSTHGPAIHSHSMSARVFGSETSGTINSSTYDISGDAAKHKYHRNNIEKVAFSGSSSGPHAQYVTASSYDNAFVSHTIPRTDKQYTWITGSLI